MLRVYTLAAYSVSVLFYYFGSRLGGAEFLDGEHRPEAILVVEGCVASWVVEDGWREETSRVS